MYKTAALRATLSTGNLTKSLCRSVQVLSSADRRHLPGLNKLDTRCQLMSLHHRSLAKTEVLLGGIHQRCFLTIHRVSLSNSLRSSPLRLSKPSTLNCAKSSMAFSKFSFDVQLSLCTRPATESQNSACSFQPSPSRGCALISSSLNVIGHSTPGQISLQCL